MIHGRIGREGTMLYKGTYIKDLSYLGRKIPSTIYVDFDDIVVPHHTENCIILPEWDGDEDDRALYDISPFLENAA
jgi:carboxy-terminal domain RNA polymerase II polypeptide A small phosphatase